MSPTVPRIRTRVGLGAGPDNLYFGLSQAKDLSQGETLSGLVALSVMGRRLSAEESALLDDVAVAIVAADARIWPLKLTRLAAAYGRAFPAIAAGLLVFDSERMGPASAGFAAAHLLELDTLRAEAEGKDLARAVSTLLEKHTRIGGFGVPFRPFDERLVVLRTLMARHGRTTGRYWLLSEALTQVLSGRKGLKPNLSLGVAAALLDVGMTPEQVSATGLVLQSPLVVAHAVEGARQVTEVLRRLPDECVRYVGAPARSSPRACPSRS
jgi:hypothetical protein